MATVTYIKYDRQNHAALNRVCDYVSQTAKTEQVDGSQLVSGINCVGELAPSSLPPPGRPSARKARSGFTTMYSPSRQRRTLPQNRRTGLQRTLQNKPGPKVRC